MADKMIATTPLRLPRSTRRDMWRGLTSARAGVVTPVAFFPLLREDALRGSAMIQVRMAEAVRTVVNPIRVSVQAHLVSKVAMARFDGSVETLNRSYMGENLPGGGAAPPWDVVDGNVAGKNDTGHAVFDKLGVHYGPTDRVSADLVEAYNLIQNWRRAAISAALTKRSLTDASLARALWHNRKLEHIKPSFDAAMMEGAIELSLQGTMPLKGIVNYGDVSVSTSAPANMNYGTVADLGTGHHITGTGAQSGNGTFIGDQLSVDLAASSGVMTLANLRLAQQTQSFAKMRERYNGVPDEYLIDLLMQGINVPADTFKEPILIGEAEGVIGQVQRFATDGASLEQSVTNGMLQLSMSFATPAVTAGGFVLITMEIVPEQLNERICDTALVVNAAADASDLPNALNDYLDPQKVEVVTNKYADVLHGTPSAVFGYQPLNADWVRDHSRVGGKFKRPAVDAFIEDRQRIWAVEKTDPTLSEDFYLCPSPFPHTPFADTAADPFEVIVVAPTSVRGLTVFGAGFEEDADHYDKIIAGVDTGRIVSSPPGALIEEAAEVIEAAPKTVTKPAADAVVKEGEVNA